MTTPIEAVIMKHVGAPAMEAIFVAVAFGGSCLIGLAFLAYGAQSELSRWMSDGAAAIVVGAVLLVATFVLVVRAIGSKKEADPPEGSTKAPQSTGSILSSNLIEFARTAVIGISARRPIAILAISAIAGAAMLALSDGEKDARTANGRRPA